MVERKTHIDFVLERAFVFEFSIEELRDCLNFVEKEGGDNRNGSLIDKFFQENAYLLRDNRNGSLIDKFFQENAYLLPKMFPNKFDKFKNKKFMEEL